MLLLKLTVFVFMLANVFADNLITYKIPISDELKQTLGYPQPTYLNFTAQVAAQGYVAQEHTVTTEDGYILTLWRMQSPNCSALRSPPVLVMHGSLLNSDSFLGAGRGAGLAYLMADSCYDTWVGNKRGTNYGRRHVTLDPDADAEFWKFSIDESGRYDIPALIDYILAETSSELINFVGFSQGGTAGIIACTDRPEYNAKINVSIAIAPATRLQNTRSVSLKWLCETIAVFEGILDIIGFQELFFKYSLLQVLLEFICQHEPLADTCIYALKYLDAYDPGSKTTESGQIFWSQFFMGLSTQSLSKLGQNFLRGEMLKYDYGSKGNLAAYGTVNAPGYNFTNMVSPLVLIGGPNDHFSDLRDIHWLGSQMKNVLEVYNVTNPNWDHFDVLYSKNIPVYLYPKVEEYLSLYSS